MPTQNNSLPSWFQELQKKALEQQVSIAPPARTEESWRFGNRSHVSDLSAYKLPKDEPEAEVKKDILAQEELIHEASASFSFLNDCLIKNNPLAKEISDKGVICLPLEQALREQPELLQAYFEKKELWSGSEKFAALHFAHMRNGFFLHVPDNIEIELPIYITHWISGAGRLYLPHTFIQIGAHSKATVIERHLSAEADTAGFLINQTQLIAGEGSHLKHLHLQELNIHSKSLTFSSSETQKNAHLTTFTLNTGAAWARQENHNYLTGEGAHSDMLSVSLPNENQEYDQRTLQIHEAPHTQSDLLYKNALFDSAQTIFSGLITVAEHAHYTDAYQTCRNLLMSDTVEATAMPGLEINADQVKCSHGATSGPIPEEQLFYLESRGITKEKAKHLISLGFTQEILQRLNEPAIEEKILSRIEKKFSAIIPSN